MPTMFSPSTQISPRSGRRSPMMFFRSTDLPVPDGPRMAVMRPFGTSKEMSSSTVCDPKDLVTPRNEMIASSGTSPPFPDARPRQTADRERTAWQPECDPRHVAEVLSGVLRGLGAREPLGPSGSPSRRVGARGYWDVLYL